MAVSYVITVYNKATFLPGVLEAVNKERAITSGEIIIVDDGSTDNSLDIIQSFARKYSNIFVCHQDNNGVASATNVGFAMAARQYIRFVDGDDIIVNGSTQRLIQALNESQAGFAFGHFSNYEKTPSEPDTPHKAKTMFAKIDDPLRLMLHSQPFIPSATLAVREEIESCFPLSERYHTSQDYAMGLRFARTTSFVEVPIVCCLAPAVCVGRLSGSKARMFADSANIIADEMSGASPWSSAHIHYAAYRVAGRAINYARRHLKIRPQKYVWLFYLKVLSLIPFSTICVNTFRDVAGTYEEALENPDMYP